MYMKLSAAVFGLAAIALVESAEAVPVDVELQLLVDVSGSVDSSEFALQRTGYENAFRSSAVIDAITGGAIGSIAVQLIYYSSSAVVGVDWTLISDAASSNAFADAVDAAARPFSGFTDIFDSINFGTPLFASNIYEGTRLVMDVSGDGSSDASATRAARDAALAAGVDTINGLPIGGSFLQQFYVDNVIGGSNAFSILSSDFAEFETAIARKLEREISTPSAIPLPAGGVLLITGLAGLAALRRRARK
jgi:hypothetical protein